MKGNQDLKQFKIRSRRCWLHSKRHFRTHGPASLQHICASEGAKNGPARRGHFWFQEGPLLGPFWNTFPFCKGLKMGPCHAESGDFLGDLFRSTRIFPEIALFQSSHMHQSHTDLPWRGTRTSNKGCPNRVPEKNIDLRCQKQALWTWRRATQRLEKMETFPLYIAKISRVQRCNFLRVEKESLLFFIHTSESCTFAPWIFSIYFFLGK